MFPPSQQSKEMKKKEIRRSTSQESMTIYFCAAVVRHRQSSGSSLALYTCGRRDAEASASSLVKCSLYSTYIPVRLWTFKWLLLLLFSYYGIRYCMNCNCGGEWERHVDVSYGVDTEIVFYRVRRMKIDFLRRRRNSMNLCDTKRLHMMRRWWWRYWRKGSS